MDRLADKTAGQSTAAHSVDAPAGSLNPQVLGSSPRGRTNERPGQEPKRLRPGGCRPTAVAVSTAGASLPAASLTSRCGDRSTRWTSRALAPAVLLRRQYLWGVYCPRLEGGRHARIQRQRGRGAEAAASHRGAGAGAAADGGR